MALRHFIFFGLGLALFPLARAKDVSVAFGLSKPPYVIEDTKSGIEYEIIFEALKAEGLDLKASFIPQSRGEMYFREKKFDAVATKRKDSFPGLFPSDVYIHYQNFAITLKSKKIRIKKISDLSQFSVRGFQTAKTLLGADFNVMAEANPKYFEVANQQFQVAQLFGHRVEVIVADGRIVDYFADQIKTEQKLTDEIDRHEIFPPSPYVVIFHDESLRNLFNKGLAKIKSNKTYDRILQKYKSKN